ncbi:hypothetical protein [Haloarcula marina]|uniref:hypothetical protein n=1 Tax=Haloarcula marina TaxID=2961574 RepID=UPI0020B84C35|nr:hypothetical protein [Halomicroarcula marina]
MAEGEATTEPTKIDLEKVFQKNPNQTVDFEIVFAGLLATLLLTVSNISPILDFLSVVGAISLLFFTMLRRMALDNPFAHEEYLMEVSLTVIFITTFYSIIYLVMPVVERIPNWLNANFYLSLGALLFVVIYGVAIVYEISFRDFILWAGILFYNRHIDSRGNATGDRLLLASKWIIEHSLASPESLPDEVSKINDVEAVETNPLDKAGSSVGIVLGISAFIGIIVISVAIAWFVVTGAVFAFGLGFAVLMLSLIPLVGLTEFWFARYGNTSFKELTNPSKRFPLYILAYLAIALAEAGIPI